MVTGSERCSGSETGFLSCTSRRDVDDDGDDNGDGDDDDDDVLHEQLRAKKRERKKKHRKGRERGSGGKREHSDSVRAQSEEKERGHDGRRRHRDKEKGSHTIRKDSASPRTRIHKVQGWQYLP